MPTANKKPLPTHPSPGSAFPDPIIQMIFQHIPQFVFWKDTRSVYLGCNNKFAHLLGFQRPEDIIGKTDDDIGWLLDGDTAMTFRQGDQRTLQGHFVTNEEEWLSTPSGQKLLALVNKAPIIDAQGQVCGVLGVATDITEKKALTEHLAKMHYQLNGMTIVSASLAHELRTPLAALKSAAAAIQRLLPPLIDGYLNAQAHYPDLPALPTSLPLLRQVVARLDKSVGQSNQVMTMLLTNLKEYQYGKLTRVPCSAKKCINQALAQYVFPLAGKPEIHWDENSVDFTFDGKELLLIHVLFNLLKNAVYFIRKAGKGDIHIWLTSDAQHNAIHFKDTGQGIPAQHVTRIFEPFFTVDTRKGTGIGLAFCAFILHSFGGDIHCRSVHHHYTEFILTFPKKLEKKKQNNKRAKKVNE